ncbi:DUF1036 domain-containing protein [Pontibacter sp. Tf4]|uniref:DUF1036 domain-containing protein n=1 Tax=Pontibacter sp. Tf4 TaxID=2761620 RepID=UPI00162AB701|nr:DUF1036 domain-containing protein [Pontibacter sp. Tf4]MBB6609689.1 DUF1036 domain-containing protein [Pontibacter sp. Tf4]
MHKLLLIFLACSLFAIRPVSAQLKVINPSNQTVSIAIGFYHEKGLFKGWHTQGWINIAAHDSATLLPEGIASGQFYYFGKLAGCDQLFQGQYAMQIQPTEAFSIANAATDSPITLSKGLQKVGFVKVDVPEGKRQYTLQLPLVNCTQNGVRQGAWTVYLDRDKEEVQQQQDAAFIRNVTYQNGKPIGLVRDYYANSNMLQWDGKLLKEHPEVRQGTSITYDEKGQKIEEAVYHEGKIVGNVRRWDINGKEINIRKVYKTVTVIPPHEGYLFSYYNSQPSRTFIPIKLPDNTLEWYYEFIAFRNKAELQAAQDKFKLASELTLLIDQSGILKLTTDFLTAPPGGDVCNVYLFDSKAKVNHFMQKQNPNPVWEGSRENLTAAIVPVKQKGENLFLGFYNPASLDGIHFAVEVVAIVEEPVEFKADL